MQPPEPTERSRYRPLAAADAEVLHAVWGAPEVMRYPAFPANRASARVMEKIGMTFQREVEKYGESLVEYAIGRPPS